MNNKHTPGPWRLKAGRNIGNTIEGYSGRRGFEGDDGYRTVALYQSCEPTGLRAEEVVNATANARLIAAAPEMLEALQEIVAAADGDWWEQLDATLEKSRAAIAKATGGAA